MDKNEFLPCWPEEWFAQFLSQVRTEHISSHPEMGPLYDKIESVLGFPKDNIVITAGSDAAIRTAFDIFVESGDEVIIPSPTFAMYYVYSQIFRARLVEVHYDNDLNINEDTFLKIIGPKTRLIAVANPNSPTGTVMNRQAMINIIEKAAEYGAAVLIDEAYHPFYEETMTDMVRHYDNVMVTRTFSKAAGMAGMRVGFLFTSKDIAKMAFTVKPMYEITFLSALMAEYALDNYHRVLEYVRSAREGKDFLSEYFQSKGFAIYKGYANFLHVDFGVDKENIIAYLKKNKVLFKDYFEHPSLKRFSRFTVGPKEFLTKFTQIFDGFNPWRIE